MSPEFNSNDQLDETDEVTLPVEPIDRVIDPIARFFQVEAASGVVLLVFTLAALLLSNSPLSEVFLSFWETPVGFSIGAAELSHPLKHWINDGLMVIFFFFVALEIKRELFLGELRELRAAALPIAAALGGMIVPAVVYLGFQWGREGQDGWGIPMATDIAFVVGCIAFLGTRVPNSLRVLLLSLAISDDIGAILVIAIGYSSEINWIALAWGCGGIGFVIFLSKIGVRMIPLYVLLGVAIWLGFHESGVHATIAGVILGLLTPVRPWVAPALFARFVSQLGGFFKGESWRNTDESQAMLRSVVQAARETNSPVEQLLTTLHPWVSFVIVPLFALANAGVPIQVGDFTDSVAIAVTVGLIVGKPVGIFVFCWLAVRTGLAKLPEDISWSILAAAGCLAGIGFTMSLFIAGLALSDDLLNAAKIGVLSGSALSAVIGMACLFYLLPRPTKKA